MVDGRRLYVVGLTKYLHCQWLSAYATFVFGVRVLCNLCTMLGRTINHTTDVVMTNFAFDVATLTETAVPGRGDV